MVSKTSCLICCYVSSRNAGLQKAVLHLNLLVLLYAKMVLDKLMKQYACMDLIYVIKS